MKLHSLFFVTLTIVYILTVPVSAGFKIDKKVYRIEKLDEALADARAGNKPVTFVYTREDSSCGLCRHASLTVMDSMQEQGVVIYARAGDRNTLPPIVKDAVIAPEAGKYIPKTIVVDAELTKIIAYIPYAQGGEYDKRIKKAQRAVKDYYLAAGERVLLEPDPIDQEAASHDELRTWRSTSGSEVEAKLIRRTGYTVVLEKPDGRELRINFQKLSEEDQQFIQSNER